MKFHKIFSVVLLYFSLICMLGSCAEAEMSDLPGNIEGEKSQSFIHVRIAGSDGLSTRGEESVFEPGSNWENRIDDIAFYFFREDGTPFTMTGLLSDSDSNCVLPLTSTNGGVLLMLGNNVSRDNFPSRLVAVANLGFNYAYNQLAGKRLEVLQKEKTLADLPMSTDEGFLMTSSTWHDSEKGNIFWSDLKAANICDSPVEANENPVSINLERLTAKVAVFATPASGKGKDGRFIIDSRPVVDKDGNSVQRTFHAEILGWDLNATTGESYLIKNVNDNDVPFPEWNYPGGNRSYWATTSPQDVRKAFSWGTLSRAVGNYAYCYENTLDYEGGTNFQDADTDATKVLIKARVTDADGKPQDLISFAGTLYSSDDFRMKVANFAGGEDGDKDLVEFRREVPGKLHIVSTYYNGKKLPEFDNIRHWEDGICYYVANIRHAYTKDGKPVYGVVRNHIYHVTVTAIVGLGIPGGPGDHPSPENPDPELSSFVSAEVKVLDWHLLNFDVDVES